MLRQGLYADKSFSAVFAHILQVLSQFNTRETWNSDIALAKQAGIDGL